MQLPFPRHEPNAHTINKARQKGFNATVLSRQWRSDYSTRTSDGYKHSYVCEYVYTYTYKTPIPILKDDRTQNAYGEYTFDFETGNGIARNEAGKQADGQESSGGWSYTAPEGVPIKLSFTSGVGGYQPVGDHLPVAPTPVPLPYERQDY
ncbi:endocuticle structural glycoprotein SgAbd-8-like [Penaeus vannamei]|uniref:endocuticle structural glycoprotein SgAbd-8-like n=1 Tax=Penaeus vannamei TaxID=6689 RepID=UPI00387F53E2